MAWGKKASIDDRLIAKQKQEEAIDRLPSSYGLVTADRLLARLGISLSPTQIAEQIQVPETYFHGLMFIPAKRLTIRGEIERCRDIQAYGQQKLIHYLFSGEASKEESEPGQTVREDIESKRQYLVDMGERFTEWEKGCADRTTKIFDELKERTLAWRRTVDMVIDDLKLCLSNNGVEGDEDFYSTLHEHVLECSARLTLSEEQCHLYKVPAEYNGIIEKTVICVVEEKLISNTLNAALINKMRQKFEELDALLKSDCDSLRGFNQSEKQRILEDNNYLADMAENLESHVVAVSQKIFKYYQEYSSDQSLKVDAGDALTQGVDESVADDYKALQI
jgi:hypothetical protein